MVASLSQMRAVLLVTICFCVFCGDTARSRDYDNPYASLFFAKRDQFGPFRLSIEATARSEDGQQKHFAYSRVLAHMLTTLSARVLRCSAIIVDDYDLEGFWIRKARDKHPNTKREDCAADLALALKTYRPTVEEVNRARLTIIERELPQGPPPILPNTQMPAFRDALREAIPNRDAVNSYFKNGRPDQRADFLARQEAKLVRAAVRNALAKVLPEDWPDRLRLSLTVDDYQSMSPPDFIAWLADLQSRGGIRLNTALVRSNPSQRPSKDASEIDEGDKARFVEVSFTPLPDKKHILLSFWRELDEYPANIVRIGMPPFCNGAPAGLSPLARVAQCGIVTSYPGLAVFGVYIPGDTASPGAELMALQEIVALPEFQQLRENGAAYGFSSPIFVLVQNQRGN